MATFLRIDKVRSANSTEDILSRILKLAPGEVIGLYLLGKGVADPSWIGYWSIICVLLALVFRIWGTRSQIPSVLISVISFSIWVLALGDPLFTFTLDGRIASLTILVFTFVVPIFYHGTD
jgi:K+-sensing histidine kinase KdpD